MATSQLSKPRLPSIKTPVPGPRSREIFEQEQRYIAPGRQRISSLAEVATGAGYYDQAHLNRDVSALAGCTPAELAGELGSGGPPDP